MQFTPNLRTLALAPIVSMLVSCSGTASSQSRTPQPEAPAAPSAKVMIDSTLRENPYYLTGLRQGQRAGQDRAGAIQCQESDLFSATEIAFEEGSNQPFLLGYAQGMYQAYEKTRLEKIKSCAPTPGVSGDPDSGLENVKKRMNLLREKYERSLDGFISKGCSRSKSAVVCPTEAFDDISQDYFAAASFYLDDAYYSEFNVQVDDINQKSLRQIQTSNRSLLDSLMKTAQKANLTDADIDHLRQTANSLQKSNQAVLVKKLDYVFE